MGSHRCFGCGKQIESQERHIHVGLEEWGAREGLDPLSGDGLGDDFLKLPFCEGCTQETDDGWQLERHDIDHPTGRFPR